MKKNLLFLFIPFFLIGCQPEQSSNKDQQSTVPFTIDQAAAVTHEFLSIYPIVASEVFIAQNEGIRELIGLKEAIGQPRFRITEKKPYGRFDDENAVNRLTVQNKTTNTVFLMSGDVVQGGRQDRVLAHNRIIPPRTITDVKVFCVEKGRWDYELENPDAPSRSNKKTMAFRGYYNVASSQVRRTIKYSNQQQQVWDQVSKITKANEAENHTKAYTGLERSDNFIQKRNEYLEAFDKQFEDMPQMVGIVAISGNDILGADIFGHPKLFQNQYNALMHSYITDAITLKREGSYNKEKLSLYARELWTDFQNEGKGAEKLFYQNALVYFSKL